MGNLGSNTPASRNMGGRKILYSNHKVVTQYNLVEILKEVEETHTFNSNDIDYLYRYEKGYQPILTRVKTVRPEINNLIVENRAHEIVQFKNGYQFGSGGFYVKRTTESPSIEILNTEMSLISKDAYDIELGFWLFLCGVGYRMTLPGDKNTGDKIDMRILDPRFTGQVMSKSFNRNHLLSFTYVQKTDGSKHYYGYTSTHYFEVDINKVIVFERHSLPEIPIVEYVANPTRSGSFERVLGMLDAINMLQSDRLNAVNQFVQSFLKLKNVNLEDEDIAKINSLGAIKFYSQPGLDSDVDLITAELNQVQTQTLKDDLYQTVLVICAMPDRKGGNRSTGDTGTAVELRDGWANAETSAKETEMLFKRSEKKTINLLVHTLNIVQDDLDLDPKDIEVKFLRSPRNDQVSASQAMLNQAQFGINPKHIIANSNLYGDPEQVYQDSELFLKKWEVDASENPVNAKQPTEVPPITNVQSQELNRD